jgi:hypothetical protein
MKEIKIPSIAHKYCEKCGKVIAVYYFNALLIQGLFARTGIAEPVLMQYLRIE